MSIPEFSGKPFDSLHDASKSSMTSDVLIKLLESIQAECEKNYFLIKKKFGIARKLLGEEYSKRNIERVCGELRAIIETQEGLYINYKRDIPRLRRIWSRITERLVESDEVLRNDQNFVMDMKSIHEVFNHVEKILSPGLFKSGMIEIYERQKIYLKDKDLDRFNQYVKKEQILLHDLEVYLKDFNMFSMSKKLLTGERGMNNHAMMIKITGVAMLSIAGIMSVAPFAANLSSMWHSGPSTQLTTHSETAHLNHSEYLVESYHSNSHHVYDYIRFEREGREPSFMMGTPSVRMIAPSKKEIILQNLQDGSKPKFPKGFFKPS